MDKTRIFVVNGPNINMLGAREPQTYGRHTFGDLNALLQKTAERLGVAVSCFQSNSEGEIVTAIQQARGSQDFIVLNAAAYTHTSVAIRDAVLASGLPMAEVHISNVHKRENFRHKSYLSDIAECVICGAGIQGYAFAMEYAASR